MSAISGPELRIRVAGGQHGPALDVRQQGGFRFHRQFDEHLVNINTLRPYSAWSIPITRRDPGPDGVLGTGDDAGKVTLFDYTPPSGVPRS